MTSSETLSYFQNDVLREFTKSLGNYIDGSSPEDIEELRKIYQYHLGINDDQKKQGKRIRPLLTLLCCAGTDTDWKNALPAAISIELLHNFSLIHDDIEDNGQFRRGKKAVWVKWGLPLGLNAGDAMFTSAFEALLDLKNKIPDEILTNAFELLITTCKQLTLGQHLDITFEKRETVSIDEYLMMIKGKTAALIGCSAKMGALIGGLDLKEQRKYYDFGTALGIAFQIYDDWLGIWGDSKKTGKPTTTDIIQGKKTYPIILGLKKSHRFKRKFTQEDIPIDLAIEMAEWLKEDGIKKDVEETFRYWSQNANGYLMEFTCTKNVRNALHELTNNLLKREK